MVILLCGWELLTLSHHFAKYDGYRCYERGDMFPICHVTSRDHMNKETCNFVSGSPSTKVNPVLSLIVTGLVEVEI